MPRAFFLFLALFLTTSSSWAADGRADYDLDDDGLIEIDDWADLNEIRNNLDGSTLYGSSAGCPVDGCIGFELTTDLDFDTNGDGLLDSNDTYWNGGEGWQPLGSDYYNSFTGAFHGNGHVIRNLMIARPDGRYQGLFGYLNNATVGDLGLSGPLMSIEGWWAVGGLAGQASDSQITATFVSGSVVGTDNIGGLVGFASGGITASYVTGAVRGDSGVGGLVGRGSNLVTASLSTAYVSARGTAGGLIGSFGSASASYWATDASGQTTSYGGTGVKGVTLAELQCPTGADDTTCVTGSTLYADWSSHTDAEGNAYWDFGSNTELPGLRLRGTVYRDGDGDGAPDADDDFPTQFAARSDSDGDGAIDRWTLGCDADCRAASGLVLDQFPENAAATVDTDLDGLPDQWNAGCDSACQSISGLTLDEMPGDSDNDGIANHDDDDDNNDGITDADADSDGLIDIATLAELDAVRHSLAGVGQRLSVDGAMDTLGCPLIPVNGVLQAHCHGYELVADLDFDTNGDGALDSNDTYWNGGEGWQPLGSSSNVFTGVFHGNGHVIRNLMIARPGASSQGLFGYLNNASVRELGLSGPLMTIEGNSFVGALAGSASNSQITATFVSGLVVGTEDHIGGLVGRANATAITASYVTGAVRGDSDVGGLVGSGIGSGTVVTASLSSAHVSGRTYVGGLIGDFWASASASANYWATDASGQTTSDGGTGATLAELQCPTGADDTACASSTLYAGWSSHTDAEGNAYWDFGSNTELPGLRLKGIVYRDGDGDGAENSDDAFPANFAASVDTDNDGLPDAWLASCDSACQSASGLILDASLNDTDNDGVVNDEDAFVDNAAAAVDADNDGLPDVWLASCDSACQSTSGLTLDASLNDTDNDGAVNDEDAFVDNAAAAVDADNDGLPDAWLASCDSACQSASGLTLDASLNDTDNDGAVNDEDAFVNNSAASVDTDGDGQPDSWLDNCDIACQTASGLTLDDDNDNDGVANEQDAFPVSAAAAVDADNDGLPDAWLEACDSACQSTSGLTLDTSLDDTDNDGAVNDEDAFVYNRAASVDTDGDGQPDSWLDNCDIACQTASGLTLDDDNDNDGIANEQDAFPVSAAAAVDADNDGLPDAWLASCDSACQSASGLTLDASLNDTDNDGVVNDEDAFVDNAAAGVDADNDGLPDAWLASCDSACQSASGLTLDASLNDTDNDGVVNDEDAFVNNAAASVDADNDGLPDAWLEACDSTCQSASGLNLDASLNDTDNDGVVNDADPYPNDSERWVDVDAPEMQQVPEAISVAATGETTLVTLNVMQALATDNFDNELEYLVELDGNVLLRNAEQQVSLPSGNLALQWVAVDDEGNRSEPMVQTVKVYPMVRFSLSESISGEQNLALVAISLSGPSPEYPVAVLVNWIEADSDATAADIVTEGDEGIDLTNLGVVIESAEELEGAALQIPVVADDLVEPDERFTLELASAWAGSDEPFEMPIDSEHQQHRMTFTDSNIAPTASISATQNGESGTVFTTDAGEVTLAAEVTDVNGGDSHSYQWYTDELPVTPGDQASFTFDPQAMSPGSYRVSIVVTDDGNPMLSSDEVIFEFTLEAPDFPDEGDGDSDDGDDSGGGDDSSGGENPVSPGGGNSGGSSGGSVGLWLLCLLALGAIWRRRIGG